MPGELHGVAGDGLAVLGHDEAVHYLGLYAVLQEQQPDFLQWEVGEGGQVQRVRAGVGQARAGLCLSAAPVPAMTHSCSPQGWPKALIYCFI